MTPEKEHFQEKLLLNQNTPEQLEKLKNDLKVKVDTLKADGSFSGEDLADLVDLLDDETILSPTEAELKSHLESLQNLETQIDFLMALVEVGGESEKSGVENGENQVLSEEELEAMFLAGSIDSTNNENSGNSINEEFDKETEIKNLKENINSIENIVEKKGLLDKNINEITKTEDLIDMYNYAVKNEEIIIDRGIALGKDTLNSLNTKNEFKNFLLNIANKLINLQNKGKINLGIEDINGKIYLKLNENNRTENNSTKEIINSSNLNIQTEINDSNKKIQELFDNIKLEEINNVDVEDFELFYSNLKEENLTPENIKKLVKMNNLTTKSKDEKGNEIEILHEIDLLKVEPKIINKLLKIDGLKINKDNLGLLDLREIDIDILIEFSEKNNIDLEDFSLGLSKEYGLSIFEVNKIIVEYTNGNKEKSLKQLLSNKTSLKEENNVSIDINDIIDSDGNIKLENKNPEEKLQILENIIKFIIQNNKKGNNKEGLCLKLIEDIMSKNLLYHKDFEDKVEFNERITSLDGKLMENIGQNINSIKIAFKHKEYFEGFFGLGFEIIGMISKNEVKNSEEYIDFIIENDILQKTSEDYEDLNSNILNIASDIKTTTHIIKKFEEKFPNKNFFSEIAPDFFSNSEINSLKAFLKRNISEVTDINILTFINEDQEKNFKNLNSKYSEKITLKAQDVKDNKIESIDNLKAEEIKNKIKELLLNNKEKNNETEKIYKNFYDYFYNNGDLKGIFEKYSNNEKELIEIIELFRQEKINDLQKEENEISSNLKEKLKKKEKLKDKEKLEKLGIILENGEINSKKLKELFENYLSNLYEEQVLRLNNSSSELHGPVLPGNIKQILELRNDSFINIFIDSLEIENLDIKNDITSLLYSIQNKDFIVKTDAKAFIEGAKLGKSFTSMINEETLKYYEKITGVKLDINSEKNSNSQESKNNSTNNFENISSGQYTLDTSNSVIKTESGKNISLNQEEVNMIQKNPETLKNIINLYESLERVGLTKLWNYKEDIFKSLENVFRVQFDRKDGNYLDERETKILLNAVLTSLGEKPIRTDKKIDNFLSEVENINGRQVTGTEKEVNKLGESRLEASFIEKFVGRGDMIGFKQSAFEDSLKKIN